jgi:phage-related holin
MVALPTGISFIRLDELENGDVKLFSVISFFSRLVDLLLFESLSLLEFLSLGLMKKLDIIFLLEVAVLFDFLLLRNGVLEKVNILALSF